MEYACSVCGGVEFVPLLTIRIDSSTKKAIETQDRGISKCSNCGRRIAMSEDGEIAVLQDSPGSLSAVTLPNRVRSSVSADERGVGRVGSRGGITGPGGGTKTPF
jgi:hypothetical protein